MTSNKAGYVKVLTRLVFAGFLFGSVSFGSVLADSSSNLVPNPTFSQNPEPTAIPVPLNWFFQVNGNDIASSTYPALGPDASTTALGITITSHVDGSAVWFSGFAPAISLAQYQYNESYFSDTTGYLEAEFTVTGGPNVYVDIGETASTNGAWTTASTTFNAVPGATSVRVYHVLNSAGSLRIANPSLINSGPPSPFDHPIVTLTFDDGNQSEYDVAFPILKASGFPATFYVITNALLEAETNGTTTSPDTSNNYMTREEVLAINRAGNEIGNHTVFHCNLALGICPDGEPANTPDTLSADQEIRQAGQFLNDMGAVPVETFAYPYGAYNQNVENILKTDGYLGARSVDPGYNLKNSDPYTIKIQQVIASTTLSSADYFNTVIKPKLDTAVANNIWLVLSFHGVEVFDPSASIHNAYSTTPEVLQMVIDYLKAHNVPVVTMKDGLCALNANANNPACSETQKTVTPSVITINTPSPLPKPVAGQSYSQFIYASSSRAFETTLHFEIASGTLPSGLALNPSNGNIFGTAGTDGTGSIFTVAVTNIDNSASSTKEYSFATTTVVTPPATTTPPTSGDDHNHDHQHTSLCSCFTLDTLATSSRVVFGDSWDGAQYSLQSVLDGQGFSINTLNDQANIQTWTPTSDNTVITVTAIANISADSSVFGYFREGDNTFHPIYKSTDIAGYEATPLWLPGHSEDVTISGTAPITFATYVPELNLFRYTDNSKNANGEEMAVSYDISDHSADTYVIAFEDLSNIPQGASDYDFNDTVVKISVKNCFNNINHRPVITLIGANPATVNVGETYVDPGATAFDQEDGDITSKIVTTSDVDTSIAGTYTVTYNVKDSQGLAAYPVSRTVNVLDGNGSSPKTGKITVCLILADSDNNIATSSVGLPAGQFTLDFATSTAFGTSTMTSKTWTTASFAPNQRTILNVNDSDCVTYKDLDLGSYYYTELNVDSGDGWTGETKYNDGYSQPVNNVFDLFLYSPELFNATTSDDASREFNSDGNIILSDYNRERTLVVYETYSKNNGGGQCTLPEITSPLAENITLGDQFSYTLTASSTATLSVATSTLPAGLSFATSTNTISGIPTAAGTYNITLSATNTCGTDTKTLVLTVSNPNNGGGGGSPLADISVVKTEDKTTANVGDTVIYTLTVANAGPNTATAVSLSDILPSTLTFVSASSTLGTYSTTTGIWNIGDLLNGSSTALTLVVKINSGTEGQSIINTATASSTIADSNSGNNTSTVTVTVNGGGCTSNCGGGGGGGGIPTSDISVTKTVDKATPNPGDTIIYTITVSNAGPANATGVSVTDILPNTLTFVSATSGAGSFSTTTNIWTVGDLPNASSTSLTLVATVNAGTEGQKITNTATGTASQTDNNTTNNTGSVDVNVPGAGCTSNCGGGGGGGGTPGCTSNCGGGGGGGGNGPIVPGGGGGGQVLGATTSNSCYYLYDYLRADFNNNPVEVRKLQVFLRDFEGFTNLPITGVYDPATVAAVDSFQMKFESDILTPWGETAPTGYTYILTKKKVNEIYCQMAFPVTPLQQIEIDTYRNYLLGLQKEGGVTLPVGGQIGEATSTTGGVNPNGNDNSDLGTLAGFSSSTRKWADSLTANIFSAGKKLLNTAWGLLLWPFGARPGKISAALGECSVGYFTFGWLNLILIIIIIVMGYLWYRQYKNNKKIDDINKEIDLK